MADASIRFPPPPSLSILSFADVCCLFSRELSENNRSPNFPNKCLFSSVSLYSPPPPPPLLSYFLIQFSASAPPPPPPPQSSHPAPIVVSSYWRMSCDVQYSLQKRSFQFVSTTTSEVPVTSMPSCASDSVLYSSLLPTLHPLPFPRSPRNNNCRRF